jgi:putative transposase
MTVSSCQNWHMFHAEDTDVETLGEPDARKRASRGSEGRGWCPWATRAWLLTLPKLKKNAEHRRKQITKKRFKGLDKPPRYSSPTVQYTYERDYTFQCDRRVSVGTLNGRIILPYQGRDRHAALIQHEASIGDAKLWYDKPKKTFHLLVSLQIDIDEPTFSPGKRVRHNANHYARLRKRLQKQGTRGAKRRLKRIAQRERRLKLQANHTTAKQIIEQHPHALIGLEDLTGIRERTKRKKRKRKKHGKGYERVSPKARHPPIGCTRDGPSPSCMRSFVTKPC